MDINSIVFEKFGYYKKFIILIILNIMWFNMKFLVTWYWNCEDRKEVAERFAKWKPAADTKFLFPIHSIIGANAAFTVVEGSDTEQMVRNVDPWSDICTYEISPIIDSRELAKIRSSQ